MDARVGPGPSEGPPRPEGDNVRARRIGADDRGQMFLLAGLVLALSLITMAVLANQAIHRPARESTQGSQLALGTYVDFRTAVREAIKFHLTSFGITEEGFAEVFRDLGDRRRLGLAGRDVDPIVELNGTKETRLCGGSPAYGNASLADIAAKQTIDGNSECTNAANSDGILEDEDQDVVAAAVDIGLMGPRYAVEETMVVTAVQHRYILRDTVNTTVGANVRDSPTATDRSDGLVHRVRAPTPNVPSIAGYASVPHSLYSGTTHDRDASWSVAVANPADEPLDVDRVEIVDTAGEAPWSTDSDAVDPGWPADGWSIEEDDAVTTTATDNPDFEEELNPAWDDANKSVADAEYGIVNDEPGCQELGPDNSCLKLKTEVEQDEEDNGTVHSYYWANQTFVAPSSFDVANISLHYNMAADPTVPTNYLRVEIVNATGERNFTWSADTNSTDGWTTHEETITSDLVPGETYTLAVHADQEVCDPDDTTGCLAVVDHRAVTWVDDIYLNFTSIQGQRLVWNGTDDRTVPSGRSLDFRADAQTASWDALNGGPDLDFETRVRGSTDGGTSYDVYDLSDPSGPVLDRAYDSLRGTERPTVSLRAQDGVVNVTSSTRSTMTVVVEEQSGAWSIPAHDLQVLIPTDIDFVGLAGSDCADGINCYNLTDTTSVPEGTQLTFRTQSIDPGSKATVDLRIDPPGVRTSTVYRAPMELDPIAGGAPEATADAVINVEPRSSTPYTLKMIYYSQPTTERLDRDDLVGMDVGLEMSANQAMNVTLQVWNHSDTGGWAWRTLRSGVVSYAGASWSVGWRTDDATELGVLDDEGQDLVPPLPSGEAPPEGAVAIRLLHDELDTYRLDVDLAYWRVEHV